MIDQVYEEMIKQIGMNNFAGQPYKWYTQVSDFRKKNPCPTKLQWISGCLLRLLLLPLDVFLICLSLFLTHTLLVFGGLRASMSLYDSEYVSEAYRLLEEKIESHQLSISDLPHIKAMAQASLQSAETRLVTWGILLAVAGIFLSYDQIHNLLQQLHVLMEQLSNETTPSNTYPFVLLFTLSIVSWCCAVSIFKIPYDAHLCTAVIQSIELLESEFDRCT